MALPNNSNTGSYPSLSEELQSIPSDEIFSVFQTLIETHFSSRLKSFALDPYFQSIFEKIDLIRDDNQKALKRNKKAVPKECNYSKDQWISYTKFSHPFNKENEVMLLISNKGKVQSRDWEIRKTVKKLHKQGKCKIMGDFDPFLDVFREKRPDMEEIYYRDSVPQIIREFEKYHDIQSRIMIRVESSEKEIELIDLSSSDEEIEEERKEEEDCSSE